MARVPGRVVHVPVVDRRQAPPPQVAQRALETAAQTIDPAHLSHRPIIAGHTCDRIVFSSILYRYAGRSCCEALVTQVPSAPFVGVRMCRCAEVDRTCRL